MQHVGTQTIKKDRLILRKIEISDAEMMFRNWANDDEGSRYMRWQTHKNVNEARTTIQNWFNGYKENNKYHWGICIENGEMIGSLGVIMTAEYDFKAEIGYCIGSEWWGKGYTSEAVKAVIAYILPTPILSVSKRITL